MKIKKPVLLSILPELTGRGSGSKALKETLQLLEDTSLNYKQIGERIGLIKGASKTDRSAL